MDQNNRINIKALKRCWKVYTEESALLWVWPFREKPGSFCLYLLGNLEPCSRGAGA